MSDAQGGDWPVIKRTLANGWIWKWLILASLRKNPSRLAV